MKKARAFVLIWAGVIACRLFSDPNEVASFRLDGFPLEEIHTRGIRQIWSYPVNSAGEEIPPEHAGVAYSISDPTVLSLGEVTGCPSLGLCNSSGRGKNLQAKGNGQAYIVLSSGAIKKDVLVRVKLVPAQALLYQGSEPGAEIAKARTLTIGSGFLLTGVVADSARYLIPGMSATWSQTHPEIVSISAVDQACCGSQVRVTGLQPGSTTITAANGVFSSTVAVEVVSLP